MYRDISEKFLGGYQSTASFHNHDPLEGMRPQILQKVNQNLIFVIYVVSQLLQLMIGFSLVQQIDIITIATQRCIITIILTLLYIQFFDNSQFQFDQGYIKVFGLMSAAQVLASLMGLLAMQTFVFSEVCTFHQLTAGYILVLQHFLIQPTNNVNLLLSLIQTISTILFSGNILYILICLLQPLSLAFIQTLKYLMTKQIQQFSLQLYTNLIGLPLYILLSLFSGGVQNVFDMTYFIEILIMCILQMFAYLAINELVNQQLSTMYIWALSGCVTILSLIVQLGYHQVPLGFGSLSVILIVFTTIGMHRQA
ncbi:unnamed protein product (macronuclear) [Paramecium tetraurelia]|uniref:Uncharacterized protein n=1 Tax=Paramecium tetraurelia TaxID=5888 RepID=A0BXP0_PARTE|nr:uncharacterized protein GSPATT00033160001 [Paramecium tetraurelia]CAK63307.1 unnamed protein product [Paramecium tetraurelia]|eukprot:XP_001430705.1 hypothetical protein (macronuclear) [Paramecium tetraurelia strain d4-2]